MSRFESFTYESTPGTDRNKNPVYLSQMLQRAYFALKAMGDHPTRIHITLDHCKLLMEELGIPPDPRWNPQDGDHVGKFMDVDVYIDNSEQVFSVYGVEK